MTMELPATDVIDLRPMGYYDHGREVLRPDVDGAVESMLNSGCEVHVYEKRTLMALYKNVSRRNARRKGEGELKLWTHRTADPEGRYEARWQVRLRREEERVNPFFSAEQASQYGRWLPLAEQLILGQEVRVKSVPEVVRVGQSFRFACDQRGLRRSGRMLRRRQEGEDWVISLAKPLPEPQSVPVPGKTKSKPKPRNANEKSRASRSRRV